jgi:hypothetical protein
MMHIFEFYDETFPDQPSSQESTEKTVRFALHQPSEMTTPTDVETPAKGLVARVTGEKVLA